MSWCAGTPAYVFPGSTKREVGGMCMHKSAERRTVCRRLRSRGQRKMTRQRVARRLAQASAAVLREPTDMRHELRRIVAAYLAAGRRHFVVDARLKESPHRPHLVSVQRPFY